MGATRDVREVRPSDRVASHLVAVDTFAARLVILLLPVTSEADVPGLRHRLHQGGAMTSGSTAGQVHLYVVGARGRRFVAGRTMCAGGVMLGMTRRARRCRQKRRSALMATLTGQVGVPCVVESQRTAERSRPDHQVHPLDARDRRTTFVAGLASQRLIGSVVARLTVRGLKRHHLHVRARLVAGAAGHVLVRRMSSRLVVTDGAVDRSVRLVGERLGTCGPLHLVGEERLTRGLRGWWVLLSRLRGRVGRLDRTIGSRWPTAGGGDHGQQDGDVRAGNRCAGSERMPVHTLALPRDTAAQRDAGRP
jgi:hypothetical protein